MKNTFISFLLLMISIGFSLQSCKKDTESAIKDNSNQKKNESEFLVSKKKIKDSFPKKDFSKVKNRSFVISCGTGCAMTHNVKKIKQINPLSIEVTFEIDMYINEELSETFDDTFIFKYNNSNALEKITREGETENALETFVGSAKESFNEFGAELIK